MTRRRWSLLCVPTALLIATGCSTVIDGVPAMPPAETLYLGGLDVDELLLSTDELRDITGAGPELNGVPGMDSKKAVDDELLVKSSPPDCRFVFRESLIFGPEVKQFHKTSFQTPPESALLSEAAAAYLDADTARGAFDNVASMVMSCANTIYASMFVGEWTIDGDTISTRTARSCGRIYRPKSNVLIEVTYCGYSEVVPNLVVTRIASRVP